MNAPKTAEQLAGQLNFPNGKSQPQKQNLPVKIKIQIILMLWSLAALVNASAPR